LQDSHQLLEKTCADNRHLVKQFDDITAREGQLGARLNDWKHQWSKLQPKLEAMSKDTAHLKQLTEHHEGTVCTLQQGYAANFGSIETLQNQHVQTAFDLQALHQNLAGAQRDSSDNREGLSRSNLFANTLQIAIQKNENELRRTSLKLDGFETKHGSLCEIFEKTNMSVADLSKEQRKSIASMQSLRHELDKTNETLSSARNQLDTTESNLHGLKGEVGRTSEVVQRLDHGVEMCQATFAGLQKGFVETGAGVHAARRPSMLPKLGSMLGHDFDNKRPDSATESTTSSRISSRRSSVNDCEVDHGPMLRQ